MSSNTTWAPDPNQINWGWATFNHVGDGVIGKVRFFNPESGATKYQSDEPCGLLVLEQANRFVRVTLDKGQLIRVLTEALIAAGWRGGELPPDVGVALKLDAFDKYKSFKVRCFFGTQPNVSLGNTQQPPAPAPAPAPAAQYGPDGFVPAQDGFQVPGGPAAQAGYGQDSEPF